MSENYWAQVTPGEDPTAAELETILYGFSGSTLQKWQKRALKRAIKMVRKQAQKQQVKGTT